MDGIQEPRSKHARMNFTIPRSIPGEVKNQIYRCAALPNDTEPEQRTFKTVTLKGEISPLDTIQSFYMDTVDSYGKSLLFAKEILQVAAFTQEVLTLVMPHIMFKFPSLFALQIFVEKFAAHLSICTVVPELQIEIDFTTGMSESEKTLLGRWVECKLPHGREIGMHDQVEGWMLATQPLPEGITIHLIFSQIWRDFRELRGLSKKYGLPTRNVTFQFPTPSNQYPEHDFCVAQTMAAVKDIEVPEMAEISSDRRAQLVKFGCRGFNGNGQRRTG